MSVVPPHCQPLNSTMCKNLNYIYVEMPNFWGDNTQEEADARIQVFSPLVNSGCSPSLRVFLCLLYFPPCVVNFRKMIPPCRELCEDARRGCKPALAGAGFPWPGIMKCSQFPFHDKNESNVCLKPELILDELPVHVSYQNIPVICIKEERRKGYCHLESVLCHVVCEVCVLHDKFLVFREALT